MTTCRHERETIDVTCLGDTHHRLIVVCPICGTTSAEHQGARIAQPDTTVYGDAPSQ